MFETEQKHITTQVREICQRMGFGEIQCKWSWIPFSGKWGISTSFFEVASANANKYPSVKIHELAADIAGKVKDELSELEGIERIESMNGYLNLFFDSNLYARRVVDSVLIEGEMFGKAPLNGKKVMVEFSQPNSLKAFHVGHLRNMVLGAAVSNLVEAEGNEVIRANYLGDIGLHVITWLWNYLKNHNGENPPSENKIKWMGNLYAEAVGNREESPENETEVRALFKRWDERDDEIIDLWEKTRQWSLDAFDQVYKKLGIHFDHVYYESEVEEAGKELINTLVERGLATDERPRGAVFVDLDNLLGTKEEFRVLVLLRSDGTSLYSTKDIPLAIKKFEQYPLDKSIYVVDVRQSLYLKQIFKILELMGYQWAKDCYHLAYEIVNLPGNVTIASREGTIVLLEDLLCEAEKRALQIVEHKNPDMSADVKRNVAEIVAIGAIKYSLLSRDNTKIITFDWDAALDVNGQAAPYIQYAAVRANSILKKVDFQIPQVVETKLELTSKEIELIDMISRVPTEMLRAAKDLKPLLIANLVFDIAQAFNDFYNSCPVLQAEKDARAFRLRLVAAARQTIINCLAILGISVPNVM